MFQDDSFHDIGNVLACVDGLLHQFGDLLELDQLKGVCFLFEEPGHGLAKDIVSLVFQGVDLDATLASPLG